MAIHPTAIFHASGDATSADIARAALKAAGFSVGTAHWQGTTGFLFGERTVHPWTQLSPKEQCALDGQIWSCRTGATTVMLHADAPTEAVIGFQHVRACADREVEPIDVRGALLQASLLAVAFVMCVPVVLAVLP